MQKTMFETKLLRDGNLYCPKKYARSDAKFKVIVLFPDVELEDETMETASIADLSDDVLTEDEIEYYLHLVEK